MLLCLRHVIRSFLLSTWLIFSCDFTLFTFLLMLCKVPLDLTWSVNYCYYYYRDRIKSFQDPRCFRYHTCLTKFVHVFITVPRVNYANHRTVHSSTTIRFWKYTYREGFHPKSSLHWHDEWDLTVHYHMGRELETAQHFLTPVKKDEQTLNWQFNVHHRL